MGSREGTPPLAGGKWAPRVAVIGAGMTGVLAAIRLLQEGVEDVSIFEKADRLGGTWRDNTYPGLACDIPSHLYRYSFEPNPDWTHLQAPGPEIQAYFERVAAKYGIENRIRFGQEVASLSYQSPQWMLETKNGIKETFDVVLAATGYLHHPNYPDIKGREEFAGNCFHSARWDHSVALEGKRIGIIGTGSTAVQVLGGVAGIAAHVSMFQRTPQWIFPMPNAAYSEDDREKFRRSPELMEQMYQKFHRQFTSTIGQAVIGDKAQSDLMDAACRKYLETVKDPELRAKLTPGYKLGCKRLIVSSQFYQDIQRPNVELVTEGITAMERGGVRTTDGRLHELDVVVMATGFNSHAYTSPIVIQGRDGVELDQVFRESPECYRGMAVPGFPNLFLLGGGPYSPVGNFSTISVSEAQINYLVQLISHMVRGGAHTVEPTRDATRDFMNAVKSEMPKTAWASGCSSWYLDKQGSPIAWPWSWEKFAEDMQGPELADYLID